jgi:histidinol-phosphatase
MTPDLALAHELADLADAETLHRYEARTFTVDRKADRTEVTEADRGAEAVMRRRLAQARPDHAVLGEEEGLTGPEDAPRWILDPVDGTSNFVKGVPIWATLIALQQPDGRLTASVVSAPALGRRWWASAGDGAFAGRSPSDSAPIRTSTTNALADAHLAHSGVGTFYDYGRGEVLVALTRQVWRSRGLGDFWMHCLVAEGAFDIACEPIVSLWDLAAIQLVVEEAGGRFTNFDGEARPDGGSALSSNGLLHDEVLKALSI